VPSGIGSRELARIYQALGTRLRGADLPFTDVETTLKPVAAESAKGTLAQLTLRWTERPVLLSSDPAFQQWHQGDSEAQLLAHLLITCGAEAELEGLIFIGGDAPIATAKGLVQWARRNVPRLPHEGFFDWGERMVAALKDEMALQGLDSFPPREAVEPHFPD
jgi:hypothetical protein